LHAEPAPGDPSAGRDVIVCRSGPRRYRSPAEWCARGMVPGRNGVVLQTPNATSETVSPRSCNRNTHPSHASGYRTTPFTINLGIRAAQGKTFRQIHDEIRAAQARRNERLGGLSGMTWVAQLVPSSLFRIFTRMAARSARMAMRYGVISVTAVGMFGLPDRPVWLVPLSASTVAVTVGVSSPPWGRRSRSGTIPRGHMGFRRRASICVSPSLSTTTSSMARRQPCSGDGLRSDWRVVIFFVGLDRTLHAQEHDPRGVGWLVEVIVRWTGGISPALQGFFSDKNEVCRNDCTGLCLWSDQVT